jgi:hypothetical protein
VGTASATFSTRHARAPRCYSISAGAPLEQAGRSSPKGAVEMGPASRALAGQPTELVDAAVTTIRKSLSRYAKGQTVKLSVASLLAPAPQPEPRPARARASRRSPPWRYRPFWSELPWRRPLRRQPRRISTSRRPWRCRAAWPVPRPWRRPFAAVPRPAPWPHRSLRRRAPCRRTRARRRRSIGKSNVVNCPAA